jgi:hypothetical protein
MRTTHPKDDARSRIYSEIFAPDTHGCIDMYSYLPSDGGCTQQFAQSLDHDSDTTIFARQNMSKLEVTGDGCLFRLPTSIARTI